MSLAAPTLEHVTVLCAFAHPDDEGFATGGTLAMLVNRGAHITLICATNGDVGEISDPALATPATLAQVRQTELRQAMAITGVQDIQFLNYRDSGMDGWAENQHPHALMQAEAERVVGQLVAAIRTVRPDIVITHDPTGGYGHPDHKTMCQHTTTAFALAGDATAYADQLQGKRGLTLWAPPALYYVCFPRSTFRRMWEAMRAEGISPPFASQELDNLGTPDDEVTTVVDVTAWVDTKIASLACHRTQINPDGPFERLPEDKLRDLMRTEYYTLVSSGSPPSAVDVLAALAGSCSDSRFMIRMT